MKWAPNCLSCGPESNNTQQANMTNFDLIGPVTPNWAVGQFFRKNGYHSIRRNKRNIMVSNLLVYVQYFGSY